MASNDFLWNLILPNDAKTSTFSAEDGRDQIKCQAIYCNKTQIVAQISNLSCCTDWIIQLQIVLTYLLQFEVKWWHKNVYILITTVKCVFSCDFHIEIIYVSILSLKKNAMWTKLNSFGCLITWDDKVCCLMLIHGVSLKIRTKFKFHFTLWGKNLGQCKSKI